MMQGGVRVMGFKELVSDEVRRIEQALPHSDRAIAALSDEDLTAHIEMLKELYRELHLVGVHFEVFRQHLERESERRKASKGLAGIIEKFIGASVKPEPELRFKRRF
jgi:hypothetical protein